MISEPADREDGPPPVSEAVLVVLNGPEEGREIPLCGDRVTLGSEEGADVRLRYDGRLEADHLLVLEKGGIAVVARGSGGGAEPRRPIDYGQPCRLGNTWIVVRRRGGAGAP